MEVVLNDKVLSRHLSSHLNDLGFNQREKWERILHMASKSVVKHLALKISLNTRNHHEYVGSLMEGIGFEYLNDLDSIQVDNRVICCFGNSGCRYQSQTKLCLQMIYQNAPAGYCFLKLKSRDQCQDVIEQFKYALVEKRKDKNLYLSSKLFLKASDDDMLKLSDYAKYNTIFPEPNGPSQPKCYGGSFFHFMLSLFYCTSNVDFVRCFLCTGTSVLRRWSNRTRPNNWPSNKSIEHVLNLPVYVVPVGKPGSLNVDLQWRLSFVRAETYLVQMLNGTQTKLLVILKLLVKHYLHPVCEDITSYVVKNVVLWLVETTPLNKFRQKHLMARITDGLRNLKEAVQTKCLPGYIQPEKNLFSGKLEFSQQQEVLKRLEFLLQRGRRLATIYLFEKSFVHEKYIEMCESIDYLHMYMRWETRYYAMYTIRTLIKNFVSLHQFTSHLDKMLFIYSGVPRLLYMNSVNAFGKTLRPDLYDNLEEGIKIRTLLEQRGRNIHGKDIFRKNFSDHVVSFLFESPATTLNKNDENWQDFVKFIGDKYNNKIIIYMIFYLLISQFILDRIEISGYFLLLLMLFSQFGDKLWRGFSLVFCFYMVCQIVQHLYCILFTEEGSLPTYLRQGHYLYMSDYMLLYSVAGIYREFNLSVMYLIFDSLEYVLQWCI